MASFETEDGTVFVCSQADIRLRIDGRLVRDRAGNFLFAETVEATRALIEGLRIVNGLYVKTVWLGAGTVHVNSVLGMRGRPPRRARPRIV